MSPIVKETSLLIGHHFNRAQSHVARAVAVLRTGCQLGQLQLYHGDNTANWPCCRTPVS